MKQAGRKAVQNQPYCDVRPQKITVAPEKIFLKNYIMSQILSPLPTRLESEKQLLRKGFLPVLFRFPTNPPLLMSEERQKFVDDFAFFQG